MITAVFFHDTKQMIQGFCIKGHAGYAESGYDIICSAVSALAINTINAIEMLVHIPVEYEESEEGMLRCTVQDTENPEAQLLLRSLLLGLTNIQSSYGEAYLKITAQKD